MQSVPKVDHKVFQNWTKGDQSRSKGIKEDQGRSKGIKGDHCYLDVRGAVGLYYDDLP